MRLSGRLLPLGSVAALALTLLPATAHAATQAPGAQRPAHHPLHHVPVAQPNVSARPNGLASGSPAAHIPCDLANAYHVTGTSLTGAGITIAIVDYGVQPNITSDLHAFDVDLGLPDPAFSIVQLGSPTSASWSDEITLDVEWAHALAPAAKIVLIETSDSSVHDPSNGHDMNAGISYAVSSAVNADIVSMSWGVGVGSGDVGFMNDVDAAFSATNAAGAPVTYLASTGDSGFGTQWPAISPKVIGVGGTSLDPSAFGYVGTAGSNAVNHTSSTVYGCAPTLTPGVTGTNERAWGNSATNTWTTPGTGTGGGTISGYGPSGSRSTPDVAMDADAYNGGVSLVLNGSWLSAYGGTSLAAPLWAGVIALIDQARAGVGSGKLGGNAWLYTASSSDFNDIVLGSSPDYSGDPCVTATTCVAKPGYDLVTGRGSLLFNNLYNELGTASAYQAYFTWYDNSSPDVLGDNIHVVNPASSGTVAGQVVVGQHVYTFSLGAGQETYFNFPRGTMGGPVIVGATGRVLAAQRVKFDQSFNEVEAMPVATASTNLYFTWFDRISDPGFVSDNVHVVNPDPSTSANVNVTIPGNPGCSYSNQTIAPHSYAIYTCATGFGGGVSVASTNGVKLLASQRVQYYQTFNEVNASSALGAGAYYLTWFDHASDPQFRADNIHIVYPGGRPSQTATVVIPGCAPALWQASANEDVYSCNPFPSGFGGPVTVSTHAPAIITQRVQFGSSFNETPALGAANNGNKLFMPWFDHSSDFGFVADNVHVFFPGATGNHVASISIPGCSSPQGSAFSGEYIYSCPFGHGFGGPVVITTDGTPGYAAQRVEYYSTFNEAAASS